MKFNQKKKKKVEYWGRGWGWGVDRHRKLDHMVARLKKDVMEVGGVYPNDDTRLEATGLEWRRDR